MFRPVKTQPKGGFMVAKEHHQQSEGSLLCIGGLPCSGKTTLGLVWLSFLGDKAVLIDPDVTRAEVLGRLSGESITDADLTPEITQKTIKRMMEKTAERLDEGKVVIVPSAFVLEAMREAFEALARQKKVPFHGLWLSCSDEILRNRHAFREERRALNEKDLTLASSVSLDQINPDKIEGEITWSVLDVSGTSPEVFRASRKLVALRCARTPS